MSEHKHKILHEIRIRLHALVVLFIVGWAGYMSVAVLVRSVFSPVLITEEFKGEIMKMDADSLREEIPLQHEFASRAPMSHYHGVDQWFQPDNHNGCTIEGCHSPLPHNKIAAVRSFDNFHATFLTCELCHKYTITSKTEPLWVNIQTGGTQEPPAILNLMLCLENNQQEISDDPFSVHPTIVNLLEETLNINGGDPLLEYILVQLNTAEPGSPVWNHAVMELRIEIPQHARGEYGAKLAPLSLVAPNFDYQKQGETLSDLADQYFAAADDETQLQAVHEKIHGALLEKPQNCKACHSETELILDFEKLGYSATRTEFLKNLPLASQILQIQQGQQFYIKTHQGVIR